DPGVKLIARIRSELPEVTLIPIPGASALVTALCTTGFSGNQFTFYGFLPHKKGRSKIFDTIEVAEHVAVFYESPHRLMKTLAELSKRLGGDRTIGVARELTKIYEEIVINTAENVHQYFLDNPDHVRGEFVILVNTTSS
ncbi:16S rRNA (cytidine(1402)-2'-O)-methyltransferase, partial [Patescibacteria group bacterium]|nr:16S rRNA (cytidine(1402)-2'-O)-methyltransferase [Patescibacteria group bacterium]